jgi:plastocyanin
MLRRRDDRFVVENPTALEQRGRDDGRRHDARRAERGRRRTRQTEELGYTFDEPGELLIGCHVDRHYDAGMRGTIVVEE